MATVGSSADDVREHAEEAARKASPAVERIARAGYVAKGAVYLAIGLLAGRVAVGAGGDPVGAGGALEVIGSQPFGKLMIGVLALGLAGYALWKIVQGVMDPDGRGKGFGGLVRRGGYLGSALIHGGLAFAALEELFGMEGHSTTVDQWTAHVMSQPFGRWAVALAGLAVVGVGLFQLYAGITAKYRRELMTHRMGEVGRWALLSGRIGTSARAVVILMAGFFVLLAAYHADPERTRGLGGTLETLVRQPYGPHLLGTVAAGLVAYGIFMLVVARHRRISAT